MEQCFTDQPISNTGLTDRFLSVVGEGITITAGRKRGVGSFASCTDPGVAVVLFLVTQQPWCFSRLSHQQGLLLKTPARSTATTQAAVVFKKQGLGGFTLAGKAAHGMSLSLTMVCRVCSLADSEAQNTGEFTVADQPVAVLCRVFMTRQ